MQRACVFRNQFSVFLITGDEPINKTRSDKAEDRPSGTDVCTQYEGPVGSDDTLECFIHFEFQLLTVGGYSLTTFTKKTLNFWMKY